MSANFIAINGRFLSQPVTGVQRYAIELVKALDALLDVPEFARLRGAIEILLPWNAHTLPGLNNISTRKMAGLRGIYGNSLSHRFIVETSYF